MTKGWTCPTGSVRMYTAGNKGFVIQSTACPYAIFKDDYTDANVTFTGQVNLIRGDNNEE